MTDLSALIRNLNSLKPALRRLTLPEIDKLLNATQEVQLEKQIEDEERQKKEHQQAEQIDALIQQMRDLGVDPDQIAAMAKKGRKKRSTDSE